MTDSQEWPHESPDSWELKELRQLVAAIRDGRVDGFLIHGEGGDAVYTLTGADRPYRQFLETMADGAATVAMDGMVLFANRRLASLLETPLDELVGSDLHAFCTPESSPRLDSALATLGHDQFRIVLTTRAGEHVPTLVSAAHLNLEGKRVACIVVADLRRHEESVRQLEFQARLLDAAGDAIIATDALGVVTYINVAAEQLYGWAQGEMLGRPIVDLNVGPDDADQAAKILQQLAEGRAWSGEFIVRRKDGGKFSAHVTNTPLFGADGGVAGIIGISRDVSAQRRAEERLEASERWFRTLIANSSDLIAVIDAEARLLYASPSGRELLGWDIEAILGDSMLELVHAEDLEAVATAFGDVLAHPGRAAPLRWRARSADGSWRTLETIATNCLDDPAVHGIVINARDVTESDRLQTALASSERLLREAQRISHTGHWQLDLADDRLEWLADEVYAIHGITKDRWGGTLTDYLELVHPDDREVLLAALHHATQEGAGEVEHRIIRPDGTVRSVRNRGVVTGGQIPRLVGTCQDVTDVAEARNALMERVKEQACLTRVSMAANGLDDPRELQAATVEALADGMQFPADALPLVDLDRCRAGTPSAPGHTVIEAPIIAHGRSRGHLTVSYRDPALAFLPEEEALLTGVADTLALWLARNDAAQGLAASERRYRQLADNAPLGIYLLTLHPQAKLEYHNPALAAMLAVEYPATAEVLRTIQQLRDKAGLDTPNPPPEIGAGPLEHIAPDGERHWIEIRESWTSHETMTVQGLMIDVTVTEAARTTLENAVRQEKDLVRQLQQVNETKNAFLQAVSHELRTPLTSVLGMSATLAQHKDEIDEARAQQLLDGVLRNAERLRGLIEDLLDINRLTAGTIEPQRRKVELAAFVQQVAAGLDLDGHITLELNSPMVEADPVQLGRVVHNLLLNVARHTPEGTHVWIRSEEDNEGWVITVEDDGPGVSDELKATMFEPFVQGTDALGRAQPGTGIGLHLVAQFAALHGGQAWVTDRPGGGSAFHIRLGHPRR